MRRFVLVTVIKSTPGAEYESHSGIKKLKRGTTLHEFAMTSISELHKAATFWNREGTYTATLRDGEAIFTYTYTEYPESDLMLAVSHLTRDELLRDVKELLPLRAAE